MDEVFTQQSGTGSTAASLTYLTDALGSTIRLANSKGDKVVDYSYDPYGNTKADASINNPFQYTGRENDGTGLYYYRARYYSPATHRFISEDPIGLNGGINAYAYVEGDPISLIDPLGLAASQYDTVEGQLAGINRAFRNNGRLECDGASGMEVAANVLGFAGGAGDLAAGVKFLVKGGLVKAAMRGETFFRTMSPAHYEELLASGRLPGTAETFISPTRAFSESYDGVLVQFNMKSGALNALEGIGVRDASALTKATYGDMSLVSKGWSSSNAFFKAEGAQINIGLGRGTALDTFNSYIQSFSKVK